MAADITVTGDYLKFGVGNNGALIDFTSFTGLQYDPSGTGNFSNGVDFLTPGTPFAFYSLGVDGSVATASGSSNTFGSWTGSLALAGTTYVATSGGTYNGLKITQTITFDNTSNIIHTNVVLTNVSGGTLNNVAYGVGFDPDQDANTYGVYDTQNTILGQGVGGAVSALGYNTGFNVTLSSTGGWSANASITQPWETNPYTLATVATGDSYSDSSIALGYNFGNLAKGQQISIGYDFTVTAVPEPETYAMLIAGLGLVGFAARRRRQA
ncbi:FxDxF family PEP-CTERM protein [Duganella radicis]|uniref:PEPxxWA-CTERM sorting domain-containing protein n=1 Tax=Duganella radicis TaxID=551988 RepID=A0A6L6PCX6_9BURK|nr:FxDxF family PEP-CTERM protein [Duganella radicis]MTV36441.1 PEPxxWA-CTERM sorting domain-containing protein [Duganella radicis]